MTRKNNIWMMVILMGVLMAAMWCLWGCGQPKDVVAKVGKKKITVEQFKEFMASRYRGSVSPHETSVQKRRELLETQIDNELKLIDAYKNKFDKDPEVVKQGEQSSERLALEELYNREIVSQHVNDDVIRELYDRQAEEINAYHIMIQVTDKDDPVAVEVAKGKIDAVAGRLAKGEDFEKVAKEASEDQTSAKDGGNLGYFTWGRMVDEFQETAYDMEVGEVSEPLLTNYGWHIIKLADRRPVENRKPFEETKEELKMQVQRMMGEKLKETAFAYIDQLKGEKNVTIDTTVIDLMLEKLNDKTVPDGESLFDRFTEEEKAMPVAVFEGGTVTLDSVGKMISARPNMRNFPDRKSLTDVVDGIMVPGLLTDKARREGIYDVPKVKQAAREAREAMMITKVEKAMVDDMLEITDEGLMAYYQENQVEYMSDPQRTVREIFIYDDEKKANRIADRAKSGEDFLELTKQYNEKKSTKDNDGIVGPFNAKRHGQMGKETFNLKDIGDVAGPIKIGRNYSIIQLREILPSRQKTFGEAKNQVRSAMRRTMRLELMTNWMAGIRSRNKVTIYEDVLGHLFPEDDITEEAPDADETEEAETKEGEGASGH